MSSMPAWLTDAAAVQNNNGTFNPPHDPNSNPSMLDPSMAFMQNPTTFDLSQFQNQQLQSRIHNGNARNASPAFHSPVYQVPPVTGKRPRPREDSLGASPRQTPGAVPVAGAQTPQQIPYQGYQAGQQQFQAPTPYQHLRHGGSANASPSPIMQSQQFRTPVAPQRVQTASPNPFSPAAQTFGSQISPSHSDHGSRVNTPQNNVPAYMQGLPYGPNYSQHFTPQPGITSAGGQGSIPAQQVPLSQNLQQQQQRMYQARLQQQQQQLQANNLAHNRHQSSGLNPNASGTNPNSHLPGGARSTQQGIPRPNNPADFIKGITQFMQARGLPLNIAPVVGERTISLMQVYALVIKHGGFKRVTALNGWSSIASALQFAPMQYPNAAQEIKDHYERNLAPYEAVWLQMQQRQKAMNDQMHNIQQVQPSSNSGGLPQMSPNKQMHLQGQETQSHNYMQLQQQSQQLQQTSAKLATPVNNGSGQPTMNGYMTPHQNQAQSRQQHAYNQQRSSMARQFDATPPQVQQPNFPTPSPIPTGKQSNQTITETSMPHPNQNLTAGKENQHIGSNFDPRVRNYETHGGIDVKNLSQLGAELVDHKPNAPAVSELGSINIHALTLSLRSGIHAEVRNALDTFVALSFEPREPREPRFQLALESCDDLVETLIDCAEDQVEALAESAAEVSDVMLISSYEEVMRGCRCEIDTIREVREFGSPEYNLDRAADRLICITTILRNLSFYETNHALLADATVVRFLATIIRYLGTRNMLLRTYINTLDFMKDMVTYLSNLSQAIELPGKEEALCLLQFLLSFAPCPPPTTPGSEEVMFSSYQPQIHRYLPPAVDSLAKLLARDEPNRTFYKALFQADNSSSPPFDLLTRTFALAISPIPEHARQNYMIPVVEARKPYLVQGMLAADILANLAPGPEHGLTRSWLSSEDGFALNLLRLVCLLSSDRSPMNQRNPSTSRLLEQDPQYTMITHRGISALRRLAEKCQNPEDSKSRLPIGVLPNRESLLGALLKHNIDTHVVRQLCSFDGLES
ncbi:MAG: hypothetical protein M1827_000043 [Pycnora praestabilis]|nr:MAG: hypothetical protein M1827_000043 [Pycnora praestabilis]